MLKRATTTRRRTGSAVSRQMTAIAVGCALIAGGVSAAEISMLNNSRADTSVSTQFVP